MLKLLPWGLFQSLPSLITVFPASVFPHLSGTSSPEWIGFQEAEYKFFDHRTTWDQAQRICSWFDSSLASVHSSEEEAFLATTLRKALHVLSNSSSSFVRVNSIQMSDALAASPAFWGKSLQRYLTSTNLCNYGVFSLHGNLFYRQAMHD